MALNKNEMTFEKRNQNSKRMAGVVVVAVGVMLLLRKTGVIFPDWLFSWQMLMITIGVYIGFKHNFKNNAWWIVAFIGCIFLTDEFFYNLAIGQFFWPVFIIGMGLIMIFGKKNKKWDGFDWKEDKMYAGMPYTSEDYLDTVAVFGGVRKNVTSKDFKGGEVVCVLGGAEINLSQSIINGQATLELVNVLGGTKLIVPPHWEIKSEVVAIFGGIEDKRIQQNTLPSGESVLIIRGTSVLGGIDIKSF